MATKRKTDDELILEFSKDRTSTSESLTEDMKRQYTPLNCSFFGSIGWEMVGLIGLFAPPSVGKTWLSLQVAQEAAFRGLDVYFFSLEMKQSSIFDRMFLTHNNLIRHKVIKGKIYDSVAVFRKECRYLDNLFLSGSEKFRTEYTSDDIGECRDGSKSMFRPFFYSDLARVIDVKKERAGTNSVIVVDSLAMIPTNERFQDKQKVDFNVLSLSEISKQTGCNCLLVVQNNRASNVGNKKTPENIIDAAEQMTLFNGSGSALIEYTLDSAIGLLSWQEQGELSYGIKALKIRHVGANGRTSIRINRFESNGIFFSSANQDYKPSLQSRELVDNPAIGYFSHEIPTPEELCNGWDSMSLDGRTKALDVLSEDAMAEFTKLMKSKK